MLEFSLSKIPPIETRKQQQTIFVNKKIDKNDDGSRSEAWNCWGDCWWYTQQINRLFKTGEFMREYGDCELGPKCPKYPKYVNNKARKYKNRFLLNLNTGYPIRDLENAINKCLFEKECVHTNWGSSTTHIGTRAVTCD